MSERPSAGRLAEIFAAFCGYNGPETENIDWIGMRYDPAWWPWTATPEPPTPSEDYFEWIDLLEAVAAAEDRFTMLDLGAGFGRWGIRGALAARQCGLRRIDTALSKLNHSMPPGCATRSR